MSTRSPARLISDLYQRLAVLAPDIAGLQRQLEEAAALAAPAAAWPPQVRAAWRAELLARMTDPLRTPDPYERLALGRVAGLLGLDNRPGLGLGPDGLPAPDWVEIPAGSFIYQQDQRLTLPQFHISRYHLTWLQFQAFLDAPDGFAEPRWWQGLADDRKRYQMQAQPPAQVFRFPNHPFDGACWYDIMAFCRWWSYRLLGRQEVPALEQVLSWPVRLPTEEEWEKAARGPDGRRYPWGDEFRSGYANFDESDRFDLTEGFKTEVSLKIGPYDYGGPSAPGLFPQGASPYGVMDMIGTLWDHTLSDYRSGGLGDLSDIYPRVIRGGTWFVTANYCTCVRRVMMLPHVRDNADLRKNDYGFRVVRTGC